VVDQAVSSLSNAAVAIFVARTLGATEFGAFSLSYVTFGFALNASRGLSTDPLMVRYSGVEVRRWRRAVAHCTAAALFVGLVTGTLALAMAWVLSGTIRDAFLALGLTLPGLLLQDSWRYSFFALGRGGQAVLNDLIAGGTLLAALLILRDTGHASVFWFVFAWGATASLAGLIGPFQARVMPKLSYGYTWIVIHRELGLRYVAEGTSSSASGQLRSYGIGALLGLAAVGYVGASTTLMGPMTILLLGMSLVAIPEAARIVRRAPRHLPLFCMLLSVALCATVVGWSAFLMVTLPRGFGQWLLASLWRPTYPLVIPQALGVAGQCIGAGAGIGMHGLGAARRSLRAAIWSSVLYVVLSLAGAILWGAYGALYGTALATWVAALVLWRQFQKAYTESNLGSGRHRRVRSGGPTPEANARDLRCAYFKWAVTWGFAGRACGACGGPPRRLGDRGDRGRDTGGGPAAEAGAAADYVVSAGHPAYARDVAGAGRVVWRGAGTRCAAAGGRPIRPGVACPDGEGRHGMAAADPGGRNGGPVLAGGRAAHRR
jgi:O-antigen/teichoic acid export membrane protein